MNALKFKLSLVILISTLASTAVLAAETKPADKAVAEYLRLRREGKRHHEALSTVREQYGLTDAEINQAATQIGSNGYPSDEVPASSERTPTAVKDNSAQSQ